MFRTRKSRESKTIDPGALEAANAIGKALVPSKDSFGGQVVDKNRIPSYNNGVHARSSSMMHAGTPGSRRNSVRISSGSSRRGSLRSGNGGKTAQEDANQVFLDFGGNEAKYVPGPSGLVRVDSADEKPRMVSKYVPSSHGLVKVEVPLEQYEAERKNSIRRSVSLRAGMSVRNNSLSNKHSRSSLRASSVGIRTPSGTPLRKLAEVPSIVETSSISEMPSSPSPIPRITKTVYTTSPRAVSDALQYAQPPSFAKGGSDLPRTPERAITKDLVDATVTEQEDKIEYNVTSDGVNKQGVEEIKKEVLETENEVNALLEKTIEQKETPLGNQTDKPSTEQPLDEVAEGPNVFRQEHSEQTEVQDDVISEIPVVTTVTGVPEAVDSASKEDVVDVNKNTEPIVENGDSYSNKNSLAQYMRSANPELQRANQNDIQNTPTVTLQKTPSPIKSAMKKTVRKTPQSTQSPKDSSGVYLSLTTKENTRLNAQLSNENLREAAHSKMGPAATNRNSQRPPSMMAQRVNGDRRSFLQSNAQSKGHREPPRRSTVVRSKPSGKTLQNSALYPKEPPQKRSSFEKQRPASSNLGFKNLSLRQDVQEQEFEEPVAPHSQEQKQHRLSKSSPSGKAGDFKNEVQYISGYVPVPSVGSPSNGKRASVPSTGPGFKSRFADSDSEDESTNMQFSNLGSRSTQISSHESAVPPTPPAPYNPNATLRPIKEPYVNDDRGVPEKKSKGRFSKLKKLFGKKKH